MENVIKNKGIFSNFIWRFAERFGTQIVNFVVLIILARMLAPSDYGIIALIIGFISILNVLVDSGLGSALIQKENADDIDFSTVFFFNLAICIFVYIVIFVCSPYVAYFYGESALTAYMRVLSIIVIISGFKNIQQAYVSRTMQFKRFFYSSLIGTLCAAGVGIIMAYQGCGIWSLVVLQIVDIFVDTCTLWMTVKWRPMLKFSLLRLKKLFSFGWKMLVATLLDTLYTKVCQLIIGKEYSISELAYYNQGEKFPDLFVSNINTSIDSVLFPTMSSVQNDRKQVKQITRRAIKISCFIMWPLMIGLIVAAEPLVRLFLTEKWILCVPFLRISCLSYALWPIHTANLNSIKALGRSDLFLKLECIKKLIAVVLLILAIPLGVRVIAISVLFANVISMFVNAYPNRKLLDYSYWQQLRDIIPTFIMSVIAGGTAYFILYLNWSSVLTIAAQMAIILFVYIMLSEIFNVESWKYLKSKLAAFRKGKV